jgi:peptide chain release factor 3
VIQSRLQTEYGVVSRVEPLAYYAARWIEPQSDGRTLMGFGNEVQIVADSHGRTVLLFPSEWTLQYVERENPDVRFLSSR